MQKGFIFAAVLCVVFFFNGLAFAETDAWEFSLSPYLWMPHLSGKAAIKNHDAKFDMDFKDIFKMVNYGVMLRGEVWKGKIGLISDTVYINVGRNIDVEQPYVDVDAKAKSSQVFSDLALSYKIGQLKRASFEVLAGFRYVYLSGNLRYSGTAGPSAYDGKWKDKEYWFDPIIGGRVKINFTDKLLFVFRADAGGFNAGSDMSWNLVPEIDYKLCKNISLNLGYRLLDITYKSGSGNDRFIFDSTMQGPTFGATIYF